MPVPKSAKGRPASDAARARRIGVMLFLLFVALAALLGAFFVWSAGRNVALGQDLCPKDKGYRPPRVVVILVDQTDGLSELHRSALQSEFRRILYEEFESTQAQERSQFSRIEIIAFRSGVAGALEIQGKMQLCNPGSVNSLTKWTANPAQVRRRFEQQFLELLEKELADLTKFKETGQSPILEAIKHVSVSIFALPKYDNSEKRLVIASDMLHNTAELSFLRSQPSFEAVAKTPYGIRLMPDLKNVAVRILLFTAQQPQLQGDALMNGFWMKYFARAGADLGKLTAKRIP